MRRFLLVTLLLFSVGFMYTSGHPAEVAAACAAADESFNDLWYKKSVTVGGNLLLKSEDILASVPVKESNLWWQMNGVLIESGLRTNPLVKNAAVSVCTALSWNCFNIKIEEREPSFFAIVGKRAWIVGDDGGVIKPVSQDGLGGYLRGKEAGSDGSDSLRFAAIAERLKIPVITGLTIGDASPDLAKARFSHLKRALELIEEGSGLKVSYVELSPGEDAKIRFFGHTFTAVFGASPEEVWGSENSLNGPAIQDRARRLKTILANLEGREESVSVIDLAYEKIAVVKPRETPPPDKEKKGGLRKPVAAPSGKR